MQKIGASKNLPASAAGRILGSGMKSPVGKLLHVVVLWTALSPFGKESQWLW
jgi:hypothetical protein